MRYTARFDLKFGVQVRQLRHTHLDSHYVSVLLKYIKEFSVKYRDILQYVSVDDKAIIPVGEPGMPVSTGVRGHNRSIIPLQGQGPTALDHDFHVCGIVPSVSFFVDIPESSLDSFYNGKAVVCCKDKVNQPSSALRHSTELSSFIQTNFSTNGKAADKPILVVVSDGGPDHRITFVSVKVAMPVLFQALDLDMLVCIRTCPYQSWQNIAERIMSTLNLALMNVSLARSPLADKDIEKFVHSKKTLTELRDLFSQRPEIKSLFCDSMQAPLCTVASRFSQMEIKGEAVTTIVSATDDEIIEHFEHIHSIEPGLSSTPLNKESLEKAPGLKWFIEIHCFCSKYLFQIKKCTDPSCNYCSQHPVRMSASDFDSLSFVPLPLHCPVPNQSKYAQFSDLFGKPPDEKDCPSSQITPAAQVDKNMKEILVNTKVRAVIICGECVKPRCVYSKKKLSATEQAKLTDVKNSWVYTCGSALFPPSSMFHSTIVIRQNITCSSPMETLLLFYTYGTFSSGLLLVWCN